MASRTFTLTFLIMEKKMNKLVLIILAIIFPPIAVALNNGVGKDLVINVLLSILFLVPGIIHALWLILR
ncbi:YqaE/Pmp3 family membrane protein [Pseudoalteromonas sp. T1lg23B]|uniref:YqaE/Pmp3 family membrane protein n=1 Tax=Pseudoalteromonas sp. T1lg23B TaxID=2077097 RepID=UPI003FA3B559